MLLLPCLRNNCLCQSLCCFVLFCFSVSLMVLAFRLWSILNFCVWCECIEVLFPPFFFLYGYPCFNTICWKDYPFHIELSWHHCWVSWPYNCWLIAALCPSTRILLPGILITTVLPWSLVTESSRLALLFQNYFGCVLCIYLPLSFRICHFYTHLLGFWLR